MTQEERRVYLIRTMLKELPQYRGIGIPTGETGQGQLLRSLMNVRPPMPISADFLRVQDAYLSEEIHRRGIVDGTGLSPTRADGRIFLWQGDITRLKVDAIVNAANSALLGCFQPCHSCIDNIIHTFAGVQLRLACNKLMQAQGHEEETGRAKITAGYNLPGKYILHTVGPVVAGRLREQDCTLLARCYQSCLELAVQNGIQSIAFCCISTGVFRFPQDKAAEIAVQTVSRFLARDRSIRQVIFNVFTDRDRAIYQKLLENGI
ncbi:protein-ADP-ribose hydrolase [Intestinibacillus massiliensis]|nr:protein-ADP-ribose hydrolase [Intestinibacillus massiliensis]